MKKIFVILFSAVAACLFIVAKGNAIDASAYSSSPNHLSISVRELDASEAGAYNGKSGVDNNLLIAGDFVVTLSIDNNLGFADTGAKFAYDANVCNP